MERALYTNDKIAQWSRGHNIQKWKKNHDVDKIRGTECGNLRFFSDFTWNQIMQRGTYLSTKNQHLDSWTAKIGSFRDSELRLISRAIWEAETFLNIHTVSDHNYLTPANTLRFQSMDQRFHEIFLTNRHFLRQNTFKMAATTDFLSKCWKMGCDASKHVRFLSI